ncbi:HoxN/HupN/NixA family nickel/cobalt transporter [Amycolatopsis sp. NPDC021455]|uniref:HoxN/HupN/NixA family nickel/cobalt transporter n=1 Tax=Amycolatopsis sp. NPDC021455 TaxID=3154901 RepID=UPI0033E15E99
MADPVRLKARVLAGLSRDDRRRLAGMGGFVVFLHLFGAGMLLPATSGGSGLGAGIGVTAYVLGMRHAFDADHIVAIDNTTRKLLGDGRRPLSAGFWFSLGHSTVVLVLCVVLGFGSRAVADSVADGSSLLHGVTATGGALVSAGFLLFIGVLNARAFTGLLRLARQARDGSHDEAELERQLRSRGLVARLLGRLSGSVGREWHLYPIGLLFGLGFDTATEVSLLVLSGSVAPAVPWYAFLALPVLFAAGMSAFDAADGVVMTAVYEWALLGPVRRIRYNLLVTGISVATAVLAAGIGLAGLLGVASGPPAWLREIGAGYAGFGIVALFLSAWLVGALVWRAGRRFGKAW